MEKQGNSHIVCKRCNEEAIPGQPFCLECLEGLEKTASEKPKSLRETINNPEELFNGLRDINK